jgi:hypothetical protein
MSRLSRLLVPSTCALVLLASLAFAATASAEVRTGEGSSPVNPSLSGEEDLLHATVSYDAGIGNIVFAVTSREAPGPQPNALTFAGLATVKGPCDNSAIQQAAYPTFLVGSFYEEPKSRWRTFWEAAESEAGPGPEDLGAGSRSVLGTTETIAVSATQAIGKPYNCAIVGLTPMGTEPAKSAELIAFPISMPEPAKPTEPVTKPAETVVKTVTETVTPPPPAAAKLAIAKTKALTAKPGKWVKVGVKITNGGGTAAGPIAIKAKVPSGIQVRPGQVKVPALLPGQTWTVGIRAKLGVDAKPTSTIALTATGPGLSAEGSLVLKRQS